MKLFPQWGISLLSSGSACMMVLFCLLLFSTEANATDTVLTPLAPPQIMAYTYDHQYINSSGAAVTVTKPYTLYTYYAPPYAPLTTTATWDFALNFENGQYHAAFWVREREGQENIHGTVLREIEVAVHCEVSGNVNIIGNQADFQQGFLRCFVPLQVSYQALARSFFDNKLINNPCHCHQPFVEVTTTVRSTGQNPFVYLDAGQPDPELESYVQMNGSQAELHFNVAKEQYQSEPFTPGWVSTLGAYDRLRSEHIITGTGTMTASIDHEQQGSLISRQPASGKFQMQTGAMTFYVGIRPAYPPFSPTWLDGSLQGVLVDPGCKGH